ncbi:uncharacterized protein LOC128554120, partial [Mercenaria mercenaria]|uniref:uncharacterized protein LOC128554120 n=1 Tax=Mercenaria mercenaria TaxID=6596 RepID=UPI00234E3F23
MKNTDTVKKRIVFSNCCKSVGSEPESVACPVSNREIASPVGRLKNNLAHWEKTCKNEYILDVIAQGYKLPFKTMPSSVEIRNNKSALDNLEFVSSEIKNMLAKGCISEVQSAPEVVNPLTVAINRVGKPRLVLDCRHINLDLYKYKCRFEDQSVARQIFKKGDFIFSFDIKGAYHHIMIHFAHRTYLGFSWSENSQKRYFVFNVLPFGISTAGYIFTKVLRVLVEKWRSLGLKVVLFLDDGLGGANSYECALRDSVFVRQDLINFGFLLAEEKCNWQPCLRLVWLGYNWDMELGILSVTIERLDRAKKLIDELVSKISSGHVLIPVRKIACIVGHLLSMQCVFGTVVRLKSRSLYQAVQTRASWNALVRVCSDALGELLFWKENLEKLNICQFEQTQSVINTNVSVDGNDNLNVFVDASGSGFGSFIEGFDDNQVVGSWSESEKRLSSTWRELEAVRRSLFSTVPSLENRRVTVNSDNKNVCSILNIGSKKPQLHDISVQIYDYCNKHDISVVSHWIPRACNSEADFLSRCSDSDDWSVVDWVYDILDVKWGSHSFDRFAYDYNRKCMKFNSRFWCPGTAGVDAFAHTWSGENNWLVPPPRLILATLNKVRKEKCTCTLVVPAWRSAPYWPVLFPDGLRLKQTIHDELTSAGISDPVLKNLASQMADNLVDSKSDNT